PNTQGLANFGTGAIASFSTMFLESPPQDGPVAIVSQSGAMSVVPYGLLRARGIGVRHTHATGNDADVTAAELACAVLEDPAVGNSGASCVMAADIAADLRMPLAALSAETQRELGAVLPGFATVSNPIDITAALLANNHLLGAILPIVGRDPAADLAMIAIPV